MHLGNLAVIAGQKAGQHVGQEIAGLLVEPAHDAEIDRDDAALGVHEGVARMHVGMEEAVPEHLIEEGGGGLAQDFRGVQPHFLQRFQIVDPGAAHPLDGHDPRGGPAPVHGRDPEARIVGKIIGQLGRGGGLHAEVHFHLDGFGEQFDHLDRLQAADPGPVLFQQLGDPEEQVEVAGEPFLDIGPQDLDGDVLALGGNGEMHLGDGGGGDRFFLEAAEHLADGAFQLFFQHALGDGGGEGLQAVLQLRKVMRLFLADQVRPGGQRLAELDEAGAEGAERCRQSLAGSQPVIAPVPEQQHEARRQREGGCLRNVGEWCQRPVPGEYPGRAAETDEVAKGAPHKGQIFQAE